MASITIRNLDDAIKERLRIQAAKNGRSMEEEVRILLSGTAQVSGQVSGQVSDTAQASCFPAIPSDVKTQSLQSKSILLIIGGGIAAYKSLDLIRRLKERGATLRVVMSEAAQHFVTPLAAGALAGGHVYSDLFSREDEQDIGHIRLARENDLIILAPATANRMAKYAHGIADDLTGAILLAARCPLLFAPAMNPAMWQNAATQRNVTTLKGDGVHFIGPESGEMAEKGEAGYGRMSEVLHIVSAAETLLGVTNRPLQGKTAIVTSGPTHEPIDPVRYIANRSSGKQGHAIARALAKLGADVTLVSGPVAIADPIGIKTIHIETANEMKQAIENALPADIGVFVAAVSDWRSAETASQKIKKQEGKIPTLKMVENPDILATIGHSAKRPKLVIGFAAETFDVDKNAQLKLQKKGADFIIANDVSFQADGSSVMGSDKNRIHIVSRETILDWPEMDKKDVAKKLADFIADTLRNIE